MIRSCSDNRVTELIREDLSFCPARASRFLSYLFFEIQIQLCDKRRNSPRDLAVSISGSACSLAFKAKWKCFVELLAVLRGVFTFHADQKRCSWGICIARGWWATRWNYFISHPWSKTNVFKDRCIDAYLFNTCRTIRRHTQIANNLQAQNTRMVSRATRIFTHRKFRLPSGAF